jgi:hypothetical protein
MSTFTAFIRPCPTFNLAGWWEVVRSDGMRIVTCPTKKKAQRICDLFNSL